MKISNKKIEKSLPHIVGLLLFLILPLFVFGRNNTRALYWIYTYYYQLLFMIVAFYVNYLLIVPRFFFSKKKIYFFTIFMFAILLLIVSQYIYGALQLDPFTAKPKDMITNGGIITKSMILRDMIPRNHPRNIFGLHPKLVENFFLLLLVLGFSSGMSIVKHLKKNETKQKEIEKARVDSELAFLKNQISPHFFFNSLNNIYALIAIDGDKAQKAVEKLSVLMRYLIYDSNIKLVELQKEFDFTTKYIELMEQRLSKKVKLSVDIENNPPDIKIPPLLFIPFVENAFKHGISYRKDSFVEIVLNTDKNEIYFECKNSIPDQNEAKNEQGGMGIENIKKRLNLIYGNTCKLIINEQNNEYLVKLTIPLGLNIDE